MKERILIVEDDPTMLDLLKDALKMENYDVHGVMTGGKALDFVNENETDLVILDLKLPDVNGLEIMEDILEKTGSLIVISAHGDIETAITAVKLGAYNFIPKPFDLEHLITEVKRALEVRRLKSEYELLREKLEEKKSLSEIIGESRVMRELKEKISLISRRNVNVLIEGESGSGKELVARAIHNLSGRKRFVAINCGAIPANLFESELFGFEKGAFTGAENSKPGKMELADEGTLFLDEISELPKDTQVKLLRVMETGEIERLGSTKIKKVDVRIIAATNRNLEEMVKAGKFREDLFYRINVVKLRVPPLRERKEDIPLLVKHFLRMGREELGVEVKGITKRVIDFMMSYDFPGNVRELKNMIYSALALSTKDTLDLDDFPSLGRLRNERFETLEIRVGTNLEEIEKQVIMKTLELTKGNRREAARLLGISPSTLHSKLKRWKRE
ncbi:MAG: sigma-54-dependent Fis family transcriptional regulator [Thermotoga sp.]|nr:MAG: sigma-54-dependent Fis family transcriptional regulator [Thermotoga sp.]